MMDDSFQFKTEFSVRIGDINYGGHMGNDKFLLLFHDARIRFLKSFGCSEMDLGDGVGVIMNEAYVAFKGEVFLDDLLSVGVRASNIEGSRFRIEYAVERVSDRRLVAMGHTGMVAFDYKNRKVAKIPESFRGIISH
jgi:acyl-CoA thioesterase FadM